MVRWTCHREDRWEWLLVWVVPGTDLVVKMGGPSLHGDGWSSRRETVACILEVQKEDSLG